MPLPRFVWLALSLFGFASCEKEITVKVPDHVSRLVLHSVSATGERDLVRAQRALRRGYRRVLAPPLARLTSRVRDTNVTQEGRQSR